MTQAEKSKRDAKRRDNIQRHRLAWEEKQGEKRKRRVANREARDGRSDEAQLKLLDRRPGKSTKERARLQARIDNALPQGQ